MVWYLARNLICAHWMLVRLFPKAKVETSEDERERDAEPHAEKGQHGGEGHCTRRMLAPDEEVEEETHAKHYAWVQHGRLWKGGKEGREREGGRRK